MADLRDFTGKNSVFTGTEGIKVSDGTTGERVDETARFRFNSTLNLMEYYNGTTWIAVDAPPSISNISPLNIIESDTTTSFTITGSNFSANAAAVLINEGGTEIAFTTVTRNSSTQITAVLTNSNLGSVSEPYDIKVTNASGLSNIYADSINVNETPTWSTSAGSLGTLSDGNRSAAALSTSTLVATDPESGDVDYVVTVGSLPSGLTLDGETGAISGTADAVGTNTTSTFTVQARDTASNTSTREFSITVNSPVVQTFNSPGTFSVPSGLTSVNVLVVAGGGGGGVEHGGGGGAGGLIYRPGFPVTPGGTVSVGIGGGGNGQNGFGGPPATGQAGGNGSNTTFGTLTAIGGGGGGTYSNDPTGRSGGSGGGRAGSDNSGGGSGTQPSQGGDSGNYGFGNSGGAGYNGGPYGHQGGGGGGAGASGQPGSNNQMNGGDGRAYDISGTSTYYAGGGGGSGYNSPNTVGQGGLGGGGDASNNCGPSPIDGTNQVNGQTNTGGGGGAGGNDGPTSVTAGDGGSGIVIVAY